MKILVTGGLGYVGSILCPYLSERGHIVTALDRGFFLNSDIEDSFRKNGIGIIRDDIRYFEPNILRGYDAVVDLAALSNDPAGDLDPIKTFDINHIGRVRVARLSKALGVERYILASSCSTYGFQDHIVNEESRINPLTTYAKANFLAESDNLGLADETFSPVALRFATAFGYSQRLRLDIAINAMTYNAIKDGKVRAMRDGTQYRPFIHVKDMARAIEHMLTSNSELISGKVFNAGSSSQNIQLSEVARKVIEVTGINDEIEWYGDPDTRSYRVSFDKIEEIGFKSEYSIEYGIKEMAKAFLDSSFTYREDMKTVDHYRKLIDAGNMVNRYEYDKSSRIL